MTTPDTQPRSEAEISTHSTKWPPNAQMQDCIEACLDGFRACTTLIPHCLEIGEEHASIEHISLLSSCAAICETSAKFMMLESEFHEQVCQVCAEVCQRCAEDCEQLGKDDAQMTSCAEVCRRCAQLCREMSAKH